jgi:hypothetical protein
MKTYLSIDLDYWFYRDYDNYQLQTKMLECFDFFAELLKTRQVFSVDLIINHEDILSILKNSNFDLLINIDYHDDICYKNYTELNCGTWAKFVEGRNNKTYQWNYPVPLRFSYGRCDTQNDLWHYPKLHTDWKKIRKYKGLPSLRNMKIDGICIVLSPPYINRDINIYKVSDVLRKLMQ